MRSLIARSAALMAAVGLVAGEARSEDFYAGKEITVLVGVAAGGTPDVYARMLTRHLGRHIPGNPTFVVQNLPGGNGIKAMNALYNTAPRDGTAFGTVSNPGFFKRLLDPSYQFDPREFTALGNLNDDTNIILVTNNAPVDTFDDVFNKEVIVAATAPDTDNAMYPLLFNKLLGTKFRIIPGYEGDSDMTLAMTRGEVDGRAAVSWSGTKASMAQQLADKEVRVLAQLTMESHPELTDVPVIGSYINDPQHRLIFETLFARQKIFRPFFAPPGIPAEQTEILRKAIADTIADPAFIADAKAINLDVAFLPGAEMDALVEQIFAAPEDTMTAMRDLIKQE